MQQMLAASQAMGQGANAAGGWGGFGAGGYGMGAPPLSVPSDTRPPEERFQVQLQASLFHSLSFLFSLTNDYSNYKIWDSSTPPRMFVLCWRREEMFRAQLNIYSAGAVFSL
jgi:hypothetical protein